MLFFLFALYLCLWVAELVGLFAIGLFVGTLHLPSPFDYGLVVALAVFLAALWPFVDRRFLDRVKHFCALLGPAFGGVILGHFLPLPLLISGPVGLVGLVLVAWASSVTLGSWADEFK